MSRKFSPESPVYFPEVALWAHPGDVVTIDGDGVLVSIKPAAKSAKSEPATSAETKES